MNDIRDIRIEIVHELHECLLFDGDHIVDPHPENHLPHLRKTDTLPLAELERARATLQQSAASSSG